MRANFSAKQGYFNKITGPAGTQLNLGVGNVYYVVQTASAFYKQFEADNQMKYADGTMAVQNTIHDAVNKMISERNDYVIVFPDATDYDEGETIALDVTSGHLICPAALGPEIGCMRSATLDPNGAYHAITVSGRGSEVAGLWIRGYADKHCIYVTANGAYIHHNECGMDSSGTLGSGIYGLAASDGCRIEHNFIFANISGGTSVAGIKFENTCSRTMVRNNEVYCSGATFTTGIYMPDTDAWGICANNRVFEAPSPAGTLSIGIQLGAGTFAYGNLIGITTTANAIAGGTANESLVENYLSTGGSKVAV
jgi:hypothetical protein